MIDPYGSPTTELWVDVGCHVLPSGSGYGETVAISWDRVLFLWVMSIWSIHISGWCSFLVRTCPYTVFYQDSTCAIQLRRFASGWKMRTWSSWYFSLLNITHPQYTHNKWKISWPRFWFPKGYNKKISNRKIINLTGQYKKKDKILQDNIYFFTLLIWR